MTVKLNPKESGAGMEELREKIAVIQHEQWSGWMEYLFSKCVNNSEGVNHGWVIPLEFVQRWKRQIATPYIELPENEKESDRVEADKILDLVSQAVTDARKEEREKKITYHQIMGANDWLRDVYGLSDDDTLNAGEIEDLLKDFINDSLSVQDTECECSKHPEHCFACANNMHGIHCSKQGENDNGKK